MSVRIENLYKDIYTEEDGLLEELIKLSLREEEAIKMEAASEGEDEMGGLESKKVKGRRVTKFFSIRSGGSSGYRSWRRGERILSKIPERKREIKERLNEPPEFREYELNEKDGNLSLDFERCGRKRRLHISTPSLDIKYVMKLLDEKLPRACISIPYAGCVVGTIKKEVERVLKKERDSYSFV